MFRNLFPVFYETPDVAAVAGAVTPPAAPAAPVVNPGPWQADLEAYFGGNPEAIAAADRYMREKVQPHITSLEQDTAPARELYNDLMTNPQQTLADVVTELYGDEHEGIGEKFAALFGEDGSGVPDGTTPAEAVAAAAAATDEPPEWAKPLIQDHETRRDAELREEGERQYRQALLDMRTAHPDLTDADIGDGSDELPGFIHPFMAAAGGDTEVAYAGYQAYKAQLAASLGVTPPAAPVIPTAPPVLPDATAATPPIEKKYKTIDDAMDDFFAERRAVQPPPVI